MAESIDLSDAMIGRILTFPRRLRITRTNARERHRRSLLDLGLRRDVELELVARHDAHLDLEPHPRRTRWRARPRRRDPRSARRADEPFAWSSVRAWRHSGEARSSCRRAAARRTCPRAFACSAVITMAWPHLHRSCSSDGTAAAAARDAHRAARRARSATGVEQAHLAVAARDELAPRGCKRHGLSLPCCTMAAIAARSYTHAVARDDGAREEHERDRAAQVGGLEQQLVRARAAASLLEHTARDLVLPFALERPRAEVARAGPRRAGAGFVAAVSTLGGAAAAVGQRLHGQPTDVARRAAPLPKPNRQIAARRRSRLPRPPEIELHHCPRWSPRRCLAWRACPRRRRRRPRARPGRSRTWLHHRRDRRAPRRAGASSQSSTARRPCQRASSPRPPRSPAAACRAVVAASRVRRRGGRGAHGVGARAPPLRTGVAAAAGRAGSRRAGSAPAPDCSRASALSVAVASSSAAVVCTCE